MEVYCTRPGCPRPQNYFGDLDDSATLKTVQQKYCTTCGMLLILVGRYLPLKLLGQGGFGAAFWHAIAIPLECATVWSSSLSRRAT